MKKLLSVIFVGVLGLLIWSCTTEVKVEEKKAEDPIIGKPDIQIQSDLMMYREKLFM